MRKIILGMWLAASLCNAQEGPPAPPGFAQFALAKEATPPNPWDARLSIYITNIVDSAVVDYWHVNGALLPAEGGAQSIPVVCYTGPAYWITVENGAAAVVEYSSDGRTFQPFPAEGFQMRLEPGTNSFFIPCELGPKFYRTRNL